MPEDKSRNLSSRLTFRPEAIERYMQGREAMVFPHLVSPRVIIYLWILLGLLVAATLIAWFTEVPVYTAGLATVDNHDGGISTCAKGEVDFIVLVLPEPRPRVGQNVWLQFNATGERLRGAIIAVEPGLYNPEEILKRFGSEDNTVSLITQPMVVVRARFATFPIDSLMLANIDYQYHVDVEVGSRRVISFLPWVGRWFHGRS